MLSHPSESLHTLIVSWHQVQYTLSTAYAEDCVPRELHTPSTAYTKYCIHPVLHTPSTAYTEYWIHQALHTPSTAYTEYCIHRVLHTPSTAYTEYRIHHVLHTQSTAYTMYSIISRLVVYSSHPDSHLSSPLTQQTVLYSTLDIAIITHWILDRVSAPIVPPSPTTACTSTTSQDSWNLDSS